MKHEHKDLKEKISIKWKIFLYLLGFMVILLIILWLFQICYLNTFYKLIKTHEAENAMHEVVNLVSQDINVDTISESIDEIAAENNLAIYVTDSNGKQIYNAEYIANSRMNSMSKEQFQAFYDAAKRKNGSTKIEFKGNRNQTFEEKKKEPSVWENDAPKEPEIFWPKENMNPPADMQGFMQNHGQDMMESVIYVKLVTVSDQTYVVMLNSLLSPIDSTVKTLKVQLVWISALMILLSLLIALLMSRNISKSIIRVNSSAKELAKGNYNITFNGKDYREIAELSNTLNFAAGELEKTENFRRELLANVSHDLRTPLTMIIAYSEIMRDLPGENSAQNIQVVIDESKRLSDLVNDMLDISKLQAGVMELNMSKYNLTKSIHSVFDRYNKLIEQEGYTIQFDYDQDVYVCADEFKIYQVIYNLINNAINYTGKDRTVKVRQIIKCERVRIEISDSGEGITKENLPYVWDRYYKVDKTHKRAVTGTGLGLSIVKNILKLHGSNFGVESEVGMGSTFWFELETSQIGDEKKDEQ